MASQEPFGNEITMTDSQFRKAYSDYCSMQGQRMKLKLPVRNQMADLVLLWRLVSSVGGSQAVSQHAVWPEIAVGLLKVPPSNAVAADAERLGGFEEHVRRGSQPDQFQRVLRSDGEPRGASAPASPGRRNSADEPPTKSARTEQNGASAKQRPTSLAHRLLAQRMAAKESSSSGRPTEGRTAPNPLPAPKRATARSPAKRHKPSQDKLSLATQSLGTFGSGQLSASQLEPLPFVPEWALKADVPHFVPAPRPAPPTRDPRAAPQSGQPGVARQPGIAAARDPRLGPETVTPTFAPAKRDPRATAPQPAPDISALTAATPTANAFSMLPPTIAAKISAAMDMHFGGSAASASQQSANPAQAQQPQSQPSAAASKPVQHSVLHVKASTKAQPIRMEAGRPQALRDPRTNAQPEAPHPFPSLVKAPIGSPPVFIPQPRQLTGAGEPVRKAPPVGAAPMFIPQPRPARRRTPPPPIHAAAVKAVVAGRAAGAGPAAEKLKGAKHASLNALNARADVSGYPAADFDAGAVSRGGVYAGRVQRVQPAIKASRRERPSRSRALARQRQLKLVNLKKAISLVRNGARTFAFPIRLDPADPTPPALGDAPLQQRAVQPISLEALNALHTLNPLIVSKQLGQSGVGQAGAQAVPAGHLSNKRPREEPLALPPHYRDLLLRFRRAKWAEGDGRLGNSRGAPSRGEDLGKRRSGRVRNAPTVFVPSFVGDRRSTSPESDEEIADTDLQVGPGFQAELPACRPKPPRGGQPPVDEAVWLQDLVCMPGTTMGPPSTRAPVVTRLAEPALERRYATGDRLLLLAEVAALGLDKMGTADARDWSSAEVAAFGHGLAQHGRDFAQIAAELLPAKGPHRVVGFYYNIWKARACPEAREWYRNRELAKEEAVRERAAAEARRAEAHVVSQLRRQLKEAVAWVRQVARTPRAPHASRVRGDRIARATKVLAMSNVREKQAEMHIAEVEKQLVR